MSFLLIQATEEASKSTAYQIGYNIGYFAFFRKKRRSIED